MTDLLGLGGIAEKIEEDVVKLSELSIKETSGTVNNVIDTSGQLLNNVQGNIGYTSRFGTKNLYALADNTQDNLFQLLNDIRTDLADGVQIFAILSAIGLAAFFILYGDKIFKSGFSFGEISLF